MIGEATRAAVGEGPGSARLNTLPLTMEEILQRTGIVMRNEEARRKPTRFQYTSVSARGGLVPSLPGLANPRYGKNAK